MWKFETNAIVPPEVRKRSRARMIGYLLAVATLVFLTTTPTVATPGSPSLGGSARLVNAASVPESVLRRPRVVVLELDRRELSDLMRNPGERGRHWERVGRVAFFSEGHLTFESTVGVRVHGGVSRGHPRKSLRLYFRPSIRATRPWSREVGLDGEVQYESLVLHSDVRPDTGTLQFHYTNPITYAIARRLGVLTAATVPATLVINGGPPLPYVTSEHITPQLVARRLGHDSLTVYNLRDQGDEARERLSGPRAELTRRFGPPAAWTMEQVGEVVDLDNLINWFLGVMYCGTRDLAQGTLILDQRESRGKWSWMAWDWDASFGRREAAGARGGEEFYLQWLSERARQPDPDARVVILSHLMASSEPFRRRFAQRFVVTRDSLLTRPFLDRLLLEYEHAAATHGITDVRYQRRVREFLMQRSDVLTSQLRTFLSLDLPQE